MNDDASDVRAYQSGIRQWFVRNGTITAVSNDVSAPTSTQATSIPVQSYQSTFKQQFVRIGGGIDLTQGVAIAPSGGDTGGDGGETDDYAKHSFTDGQQTLIIGAGPVIVQSSGASIPSWIWRVTYNATSGSEWRVVILADGDFEDGFDIPANGTNKRYADGKTHSDVFSFATYATAPTWQVIHLQVNSGDPIPDQTGVTTFGFSR